METRRKRRSDRLFNSSLKPTPEKIKKMDKKAGKIKVKKVEQPELAKHESKLLDLAFVMDCTGSMGAYIKSARDNIRRIVMEIVASEQSDVRLALVEYRDHPPQDQSFVTKVHDFTPSPNMMKDWLSQCKASGGGDTPEAVADALHDLLKLTWREDATKICVCISDAPPHGLGIGWDAFPNGCPRGIDPMKVTNQLAQKGVTIYMVGCEPSIIPYKDFFLAVAYMTGGQYVPLSRAQFLTKVIIGGAREEMSLDTLMGEVDAEVQQQVAAGQAVDAEAVSTLLQERWFARGQQVQQLQIDNAELTSAASSTRAKKMVDMKNMAEVRREYMYNATSGPGMGGLQCQQSASGFVVPATATPGSFACVERVISQGQSMRLVQKSIAKNCASKKK